MMIWKDSRALECVRASRKKVLHGAILLWMAPVIAQGPAQSQALGPRYFADVQLIDTRPAPDDVLPPGPVVGRKGRVIVDTGSPATFCSRADALNQGLLNPNGTPNAGLTNPDDPATAVDESMAMFGGAGGGGFQSWKSISLSVNAGGLGRDHVRFKELAGKMVFFPKMGQPAPPSILGTDFLSMMGDMSAVFRADGSVTFFGSNEVSSTGKKVGLILVESSDPRVAGLSRVLIEDVVVGSLFEESLAAFALVSGSTVTVLGQPLAEQLGLVSTGTVPLHENDRAVLFADGFIDEATETLGRATVDFLQLPVSEGEPFFAEAVPVLINPDSAENVLGTNLFFAERHEEVRLDLTGRSLLFTNEITRDEVLFDDGFESGDVAAWTVPRAN